MRGALVAAWHDVYEKHVYTVSQKNLLHIKQHMLHQHCCQTERNQSTTFAQENMTVH